MDPTVPAIVLFTRDLRVRDNPALRTALASHRRIVPLFVFDDVLLHGRHASGARTQFLLECLCDLDASLRERGGRLVVRRGRPERELRRVADEIGTDRVYAVADGGPYASARAGRMRAARLQLVECPGLTVVDDLPGPYRVFSAFHRRWQAEPRREVLEAPRRIALAEVAQPGEIPGLAHLGLEPEVPNPMRGGETQARRRLDNFVRNGEENTRLSPYLRFGCISPRALEERIDDEQVVRQLAWRDFFHQVLWANPANSRQELQERYRSLEWADDDGAFAVWCEGRTGFPLVDAAMRQLRHEGWLPNRMRLLVASFLVKDLGVDWRRGERWFMRWLLDGDEANNNGNWQWIASVGTDPAPWWRRHYSPQRHQERYDPDETYIRRWLPEYGGYDYPEPIIDRRAAREETAARYSSAREAAPASVGTQ